MNRYKTIKVKVRNSARRQTILAIFSALMFFIIYRALSVVNSWYHLANYMPQLSYISYKPHITESLNFQLVRPNIFSPLKAKFIEMHGSIIDNEKGQEVVGFQLNDITLDKRSQLLLNLEMILASLNIPWLIRSIMAGKSSLKFSFIISPRMCLFPAYFKRNIEIPLLSPGQGSGFDFSLIKDLVSVVVTNPKVYGMPHELKVSVKKNKVLKLLKERTNALSSVDLHFGMRKCHIITNVSWLRNLIIDEFDIDDSSTSDIIISALIDANSKKMRDFVIDAIKGKCDDINILGYQYGTASVVIFDNPVKVISEETFSKTENSKDSLPFFKDLVFQSAVIENNENMPEDGGTSHLLVNNKKAKELEVSVSVTKGSKCAHILSFLRFIATEKDLLNFDINTPTGRLVRGSCSMLPFITKPIIFSDSRSSVENICKFRLSSISVADIGNLLNNAPILITTYQNTGIFGLFDDLKCLLIKDLGVFVFYHDNAAIVHRFYPKSDPKDVKNQPNNQTHENTGLVDIEILKMKGANPQYTTNLSFYCSEEQNDDVMIHFICSDRIEIDINCAPLLFSVSIEPQTYTYSLGRNVICGNYTFKVNIDYKELHIKSPERRTEYIHDFYYFNTIYAQINEVFDLLMAESAPVDVQEGDTFDLRLEQDDDEMLSLTAVVGNGRLLLAHINLLLLIAKYNLSEELDYHITVLADMFRADEDAGPVTLEWNIIGSHVYGIGAVLESISKTDNSLVSKRRKIRDILNITNIAKHGASNKRDLHNGKNNTTNENLEWEGNNKDALIKNIQCSNNLHMFPMSIALDSVNGPRSLTFNIFHANTPNNGSFENILNSILNYHNLEFLNFARHFECRVAVPSIKINLAGYTGPSNKDAAAKNGFSEFKVLESKILSSNPILIRKNTQASDYLYTEDSKTTNTPVDNFKIPENMLALEISQSRVLIHSLDDLLIPLLAKPASITLGQVDNPHLFDIKTKLLFRADGNDSLSIIAACLLSRFVFREMGYRNILATNVSIEQEAKDYVAGSCIGLKIRNNANNVPTGCISDTFHLELSLPTCLFRFIELFTFENINNMNILLALNKMFKIRESTLNTLSLATRVGVSSVALKEGIVTDQPLHVMLLIMKLRDMVESKFKGKKSKYKLKFNSKVNKIYDRGYFYRLLNNIDNGIVNNESLRGWSYFKENIVSNTSANDKKLENMIYAHRIKFDIFVNVSLLNDKDATGIKIETESKSYSIEHGWVERQLVHLINSLDSKERDTILGIPLVSCFTGGKKPQDILPIDDAIEYNEGVTETKFRKETCESIKQVIDLSNNQETDKNITVPSMPELIGIGLTGPPVNLGSGLYDISFRLHVNLIYDSIIYTANSLIPSYLRRCENLDVEHDFYLGNLLSMTYKKEQEERGTLLTIHNVNVQGGFRWRLNTIVSRDVRLLRAQRDIIISLRNDLLPDSLLSFSEGSKSVNYKSGFDLTAICEEYAKRIKNKEDNLTGTNTEKKSESNEELKTEVKPESEKKPESKSNNPISTQEWLFLKLISYKNEIQKMEDNVFTQYFTNAEINTIPFGDVEWSIKEFKRLVLNYSDTSLDYNLGIFPPLIVSFRLCSGFLELLVFLKNRINSMIIESINRIISMICKKISSTTPPNVDSVGASDKFVDCRSCEEAEVLPNSGNKLGSGFLGAFRGFIYGITKFDWKEICDGFYNIKNCLTEYIKKINIVEEFKKELNPSKLVVGLVEVDFPLLELMPIIKSKARPRCGTLPILFKIHPNMAYSVDIWTPLRIYIEKGSSLAVILPLCDNCIFSGFLDSFLLRPKTVSQGFGISLHFALFTSKAETNSDSIASTIMEYSRFIHGPTNDKYKINYIVDKSVPVDHSVSNLVKIICNFIYTSGYVVEDYALFDPHAFACEIIKHAKEVAKFHLFPEPSAVEPSISGIKIYKHEEDIRSCPELFPDHYVHGLLGSYSSTTTFGNWIYLAFNRVSDALALCPTPVDFARISVNILKRCYNGTTKILGQSASAISKATGYVYNKGKEGVTTAISYSCELVDRTISKVQGFCTDTKNAVVNVTSAATSKARETATNIKDTCVNGFSAIVNWLAPYVGFRS